MYMYINCDTLWLYMYYVHVDYVNYWAGGSQIYNIAFLQLFDVYARLCACVLL